MATVVTSQIFTPELLRKHSDKIFVFGDNLTRTGKTGQAVIRDEPNAYGIVTKRKPSMSEDSFFSDRIDEMTIMCNDVDTLFLSTLNKTIIFPSNGIGTGLSELKLRSPAVWFKLKEMLNLYFGYYQPD